MASPGNQNQPGGPFDLNKFFKPPTSPTHQNPNSNLSSSPFPPFPPSPSSSYPPPTGPFSYPPQSQTNPFHHPQFHIPPYPQQQDQFTNLYHQRSVSYPTPPLPPQNPNDGATLMALLGTPTSNPGLPPQPTLSPTPIQPSSSAGSSEFNPTAIANPSLTRIPSSKIPKGRHLIGENAVYDIDLRLPGEVQPQLEVTPITKYVSDPGLVLGRQIAVNRTYICYGLKLGAIRVLNINTALRSLLKGLAQRVTDMAFFAEDVPLLASASVDGRVYVWKITEGPDEEDKPQITGKIVIAIQIVGEGESVHPRVCWHCHKQEVLVVGIGKRVLKIDTTKVGKGEIYSAEEPLKCHVDKLIDGIQFVGRHDGEVTDLSMCQWMTTRLVSASADGTIKIWEDRKPVPLAVLRPHDGQPVNSVTFLTAPDRPDHIILITAGPLNREVKIWASASEEGWLLPSDSESYQCTQTLELKSSADPRVEDVFFNQVMALSESGLLLLANAKKNAIYAVHLEFGPNPLATRMDYLAEFTVTMPILSFTGTSDFLPRGEHVVQVYCVQTQAIQQYALDLSQCFPPPMDNVVLEKSDSSVSRDANNIEGFSNYEPSGTKPNEVSLASSGAEPSVQESISESAPISSGYPSSMEPERISLPMVTSDNDIACVESPPLPSSPGLSWTPSDFIGQANSFDLVGDQQVIEYSVDRQMDSVDGDSRNEENNTHDDISAVLNHPVKFRHPTHLVTPSEILMATSSSETALVIEHKSEGEPNFQDVVINNDVRNVEVEVKVVGETGFSQNNELGSREESKSLVSEITEKPFCSQASDLGMDMARECRELSSETYIVASVSESQPQHSSAEEEVRESTKDISGKVADSSTGPQPPAPTTKGKKQKGKANQGSAPSSPSPSIFNSTGSSNEAGVSSSIPSIDAAYSQILAVQEMLNQLTTTQKEMQKQMSVMVTVPVTKEGKRVEAALGRSMEKAVKANTDALWARFQEENAKQEKLARERTHQIESLITNCISKDLPAMLERTVKKEFAAVGPAVARIISPSIEKTVSLAIAEAFQRGVGDKAVNQLEKSVNSKLEATVARQIQAQFQTSGKQALLDTLKSSLEASVVPAFEKSCKAMFEQVDATFQKGMVEHTSAAQQQFESTHSPLALALRDAINSATSMTRTLSGELADGQRKVLALAVAGANSNAVNPLVTQLSNGPLVHEKIEAPLDPTKELSRLISERKYEEAFTAALQRSDVSFVSWLCSQVDLPGILSMVPIPLSQGVLLSLLQQLACCDISKDTTQKLAWMTDVAVAINPSDPMIAVHVRPIFEQVYQILNHNRSSLPTLTGADLSSIRLVMHVINSMLTTCK